MNELNNLTESTNSNSGTYTDSTTVSSLSSSSTVLSYGSGYYYTYPSGYSWTVNQDLSTLLSKEDKREFLKKLIEDEDDLMPILKDYLVGYLEKVLDNPEPIIKDLIKEKDEKIQELSKKIEDLEKKVSELSRKDKPIGINPQPYIGDYPDSLSNITWSNLFGSSSGITV